MRALDGVAGVGNVDDLIVRTAAAELGGVLVADDRRGTKGANQRHGDGDLLEPLPEVEVRVGTPWRRAVLLVSPDPGAILALDGVMHDAPAQRGLGAAGVEREGAR